MATTESSVKDKPFYVTVFGEDEDHYYCCFSRDELLRHDITGHGPCMNRQLLKSLVTILDEGSIRLEYGGNESEEKEETEE